MIVALGKFAAQCLLRTDAIRLRGCAGANSVPRRDPDSDLPSRVPAANPSAKRDVWDDMKKYGRSWPASNAEWRMANAEFNLESFQHSQFSVQHCAFICSGPRSIPRSPTYRVPDTMALPPVGARVRVPVGSRTLTGCVVAHDAAIGEGTEQGHPRGARPRAAIASRDRRSVSMGGRILPGWYRRCARVAMPPGARASKARGFKRQRIAAVTVHRVRVG